uniref:FXYD domain-containing ion transport regulator n=1 Tax=Poecilia reticulata TaxID=8081 RepID=A0A3P9N489_POERE
MDLVFKENACMSPFSFASISPTILLYFIFFISDYESLRIGGLVFAIALFLLGIFLVASKYTIRLYVYIIFGGIISFN